MLQKDCIWVGQEDGAGGLSKQRGTWNGIPAREKICKEAPKYEQVQWVRSQPLWLEGSGVCMVCVYVCWWLGVAIVAHEVEEGRRNSAPCIEDELSLELAHEVTM